MENNRIRKVFLLFAVALVPMALAAHGISDADKERMLTGGNLQYIGLGAVHMLTGYDHLLFLFGVIFFLNTFREIVKFITAFTVGHCFTLIVATFLQIAMNYYLIDAFIALTVCYKGFDNIDGFKKYLEINSPNLLRAVFIFGLIHGFGLSTRLQQLPLGDDHMAMLLRILSFNLGVELGQIAALSCMLIFMSIWRKRESFMKFSFSANVGLIFAGVLLLFMQLHGYAHSSFPDDFGFATDNHYHAHEQMKLEEKRNSTKIKDNLFDKK